MRRYIGDTMESATTNPQGCSITRTSITLPLITKSCRAKLANKHCKLCLLLCYLLSYLTVARALVIINSLIITARLKNSQISRARLILLLPTGATLRGEREVIIG